MIVAATVHVCVCGSKRRFGAGQRARRSGCRHGHRPMRCRLSVLSARKVATRAYEHAFAQWLGCDVGAMRVVVRRNKRAAITRRITRAPPSPWHVPHASTPSGSRWHCVHAGAFAAGRRAPRGMTGAPPWQRPQTSGSFGSRSVRNGAAPRVAVPVVRAWVQDVRADGRRDRAAALLPDPVPQARRVVGVEQVACNRGASAPRARERPRRRRRQPVAWARSPDSAVRRCSCRRDSRRPHLRRSPWQRAQCSSSRLSMSPS